MAVEMYRVTFLTHIHYKWETASQKKPVEVVNILLREMQLANRQGRLPGAPGLFIFDQFLLVTEAYVWALCYLSVFHRWQINLNIY